MAEWLDGWMAEWLDGWLAEWLDGWLAEWLDGWMAEWLDGWLAEWLDGWLAGGLVEKKNKKFLRKASSKQLVVRNGQKWKFFTLKTSKRQKEHGAVRGVSKATPWGWHVTNKQMT